LGGGVTSDPYAVSHPTGLYVFVRGNDNAVWYQPWAAGAWSGWISLGGGASAGPVSAGDASSGLFVFARGSDAASLWFRRLVAGGLGEWEVLRAAIRPG